MSNNSDNDGCGAAVAMMMIIGMLGFLGWKLETYMVSLELRVACLESPQFAECARQP